MTAADEADLLLFVGGEPGPGVDPLRGLDTSFARYERGMAAPVGTFHTAKELEMLIGKRRSPNPVDGRSSPTEKRAWHLPRPQLECVEMVARIAKAEGRRLTVVDVNRPGEHQDLIDRWLTPDTTLPVLVRGGGTRLEGIDEFLPRKVGRFIRGP